MRLFVLSTIILMTGLSAAQSSATFHARYGEPNRERFTIRDNINLTVDYGSDGMACQIEIKTKDLLVQRASPPEMMAPEVVDEILDELVPAATRGRKVNSLYESLGCASSTVDYYETVTIQRSTDQCLPLKPKRDEYVTILFKRQACPSTG